MLINTVFEYFKQRYPEFSLETRFGRHELYHPNDKSRFVLIYSSSHNNKPIIYYRSSNHPYNYKYLTFNNPEMITIINNTIMDFLNDTKNFI